MAAGVQEFNRTESDRLNEIKGHLEIALLEKHFLREYQWGPGGGVQHGRHLIKHSWPTTAVTGLVAGTVVAPCGRPHTAFRPLSLTLPLLLCMVTMSSFSGAKESVPGRE